MKKQIFKKIFSTNLLITLHVTCLVKHRQIYSVYPRSNMHEVGQSYIQWMIALKIYSSLSVLLKFYHMTEQHPTSHSIRILGYSFLTHPSPWNGTPDVWLVTQIFVGDVIFRTYQDSTGTITASRYY